jgi:hypothetical protein
MTQKNSPRHKLGRVTVCVCYYHSHLGSGILPQIPALQKGRDVSYRPNSTDLGGARRVVSNLGYIGRAGQSSSKGIP